MEDLPVVRSARSRLGVGAVIMAALIAIAVTIAVGVWRGASRPVETLSAPPASTSTALSTDAPVSASLYVHVDGAVAAPGLYVLDSGARVVDAVAAAGGLADDAVTAGVNLARVVTDGEQLVVPREGESPPILSDGAGGSPATTINLNTADVATLDELPGIGPALADRIVQWRTENGGFRAVEDLLAVSGIGEKVLESVRDSVTV